MRTSRAAALLGALAITAAACGWQPPVRPEPSPSSSASTAPSGSTAPTGTPSGAAVSPLVTVETQGGLCANGPCGSIVSIEADGRVRQLGPTEILRGRLTADLLEALRIEIDRADFGLIESRPFTGTCPIAYDGQETIYIFTVHQGTAFERISTCEVAIDPNHPLFRAVSAALAATAAP
jgi:hypothetical protein